MRISSVQIKNFRSIDPQGIEVRFDSIAAFVGRNSSGKSSILEALDCFFNGSGCDDGDFWYKEAGVPVEISVSFQLEPSERTFPTLMYSGDGHTIVCRKTMHINDGKAKCMVVGQWKYTGDDALNPHPGKKPTPARVQSYLKNEVTRDLPIRREDDGIDPDAYLKTVQRYWAERFSDMPREWDPEATSENKDITRLFPPYLYLPVEYTVSDEMKLTKASRFQLIYSYILGSIDELLADASMENMRESLRKIYKKHGVEKRLHDVNNMLENTDVTASDTSIRVELREPEYDMLFRRVPEIMVDDGFDSAIQTKGHGMQRDAIFRLLQTYFALRGDNNASFVIAIDEPELYMHPAYKRALYASFLDFARKGCQVFYTTHDPAFVSVDRFDDIHIVRRVKSDQSARFTTKVQYYSIHDLRQTLFFQKCFPPKSSQMKDDTIRSALAHKCHGNQNEGFFADKVIIVEGDTELYAMPVYFKALGYDLDKTNTVIVTAGSVTLIGVLCAIFSAFNIPCYCVFDADKPSEDKNPAFRKNLSRESISGDEREKTAASTKKDFEVRSAIVEAITGRALSGYPKTTVAENYTVWERDFESAIHNPIKGFAEIKGKITRQGIEGKPLTAYYVALQVQKQPDLLPGEVWSVLENMITMIGNLKSIPMRPIAKSPDRDFIQIIPDRRKGALPIYASAAGRDIYVTEGMAIDYAVGSFPPGADCIIHIQGTSMEPVIPNGSYVAAKYYHDNPIPGQCYICCIDGGEMVCKQYIETKNGRRLLKSLNREEEDISIEPEMDIRYQCAILLKERNKSHPCLYYNSAE